MVLFFYYFSEKSLIYASMEEDQERRNEQDLPVLPVLPVLPMAHLNSDYVMASAQGGNYSLQSMEEYVMLSEEQRRRFSALFFMKLLQDLANKECKDEAEIMQYKAAKDRLREKELRMNKEKMKKLLHNQKLIEILCKLKYKLEDSFKFYGF